jgi:hypothetical protein
MTVASPPLFLMPAATSSQASALRLDTTTLAPSAAQCSAIERPMPRLEPVTMATLFSSPNGDGMRSSRFFCNALVHGAPARTSSAVIRKRERLSGIHHTPYEIAPLWSRIRARAFGAPGMTIRKRSVRHEFR